MSICGFSTARVRPGRAPGPGFPAVRPVDSIRQAGHFAPVSKKPHKVGEPKAAYAAKKPAKAATPASDAAGGEQAEFKRIADKLLTERKELLHKLAQ